MTKEIYLAGGCFWGTQEFLRQVPGVLATEVGYAGGHTQNPSYEEVCHGGTGHAEVVKVQYDNEVIGLPFLLSLYYETINPTSINHQGGDTGEQYRTGIYYTDEAEQDIIKQSLSELQKQYSDPVVVEVAPVRNYAKAELQHQDYLQKHPGGYCHIKPAMFSRARESFDPAARFHKKTNDELLTQLSSLQFEVTQQNATEPPFKNEYDQNMRQGIYVDITTGQPLFVSADKFISGCGWPAFAKPIHGALLQEIKDRSHGMIRTEVRSKLGDAHLGHVFEDGPKEQGGLRYCINSASLRFVEKENMEREGYADYLPLLH